MHMEGGSREAEAIANVSSMIKVNFCIFLKRVDLEVWYVYNLCWGGFRD